jgi:hypothetical protein
MPDRITVFYSTASMPEQVINYLTTGINLQLSPEDISKVSEYIKRLGKEIKRHFSSTLNPDDLRLIYFIPKNSSRYFAQSNALNDIPTTVVECEIFAIYQLEEKLSGH